MDTITENNLKCIPFNSHQPKPKEKTVCLWPTKNAGGEVFNIYGKGGTVQATIPACVMPEVFQQYSLLGYHPKVM